MRAPEPVSTAGGRPFPTHTPLGKVMAHLRLTAAKVAAGTGIYPRTLTEYLAGRKEPTVDHQRRLADFLEVPRHQLFP